MSPKQLRIRPSTLRSGRLLIVAGSALALCAFTTIFAIALDWRRDQFLIAAAIFGSIVAAVASFLLYRQNSERQVADQALENIQARVGGIVESAMDPIITVDETQRVVLFNRAAEDVFRWPRAAVLGQPLDMLIPARFRERHRQHIERFGETGTTSRRMGAQIALMALRATGEEFPIEASISQHSEDGKKLYTVILRDVTERVRAAEALHRSRDELQEMAMAAHSAREQEKTRIARELHDELGQALTALKMDTVWLRNNVVDETLLGKLAGMIAMLDNTVAATRRISADLRPLMLDDLGLIPAIEWVVQNFTDRTGIACKLTVSDPEPTLRDPYAIALFRIIQESLTNIAKHAQASQVDITVACHDSNATIRVRDNGIGFVPESPRKPDSYGLMGLRERAYLLGGETRIESVPGQGTTIEVRVPVAAGTLP